MLGTSKNIWGFDPRSISGCQLWLDGADTSSMTFSGSTITQWNDKSGNGKNATSTGTPTYVTGGGVNFNGSSYFLNQAFTMNLSQRSIFIVMQETSRTTSAGVFSFIPNPSSGQDYATTTGLAIETVNGLRFLGNFTNGGYYLSVFGNSTLLVKAIYNDNMNGTTGSGYLNGTNSTNVTADYTASTCSGYIVGKRWTENLYLNGVIHEIIIFNTPLITSQRQQVEGYLAWKWGLTTYSPVTPLSIPGCQLWLDGADPAGTSVLPSAGTLSTWVDKSGNGRNATTLAGTPTFALTPSRVTFNGSSWYSTTLSSVPTTETIFLVSSTTNDIAGGQGQIGCTTSNFGGRGLFQANSEMRYTSFGVANRASNGNGFVNGSIFITDVVFEGTNSQVFINGVGGTVNTTTSFSGSGTTLIGSLGGATQPFFGSIYEVLIFNTALTTTQRQSIEGYLARKWGFTSMYSALPSIHPFSSIRPHLRTFQPTDIPGCQLWLDGADSSTITLSTTKVTQWNDKSGNGYNFTQSTSGNQPTYSVASLNNQNTITFTSANSTYLLGTASTNFIGTNSLSMYGVFKTNNATSGASVFAKSLYGGASGRILYGYRDPGTPGMIVFANSDGIAHDIPDTYTPGAWRMVGFVSDRSGWTNITYQNGVVAATKTISADTTTNLTNGFPMLVGAYNNSSGGADPPQADRYLDGAVGELLVFSTALTTSQRQQVEGYLAHKWGLTPYLPVISPLSIPGCQLWLDGADPAGTSVTPSNGATVSTWVDKSGNGYNATAAPSRTAGTYSTSFRAVNFPTSTTGYITSYSAAPTNETMFVVFNNPSASYNNNILIGGVQGARSLGAAYNGYVGNSSVVGNLNTQVDWLASVGTYTLGTTALVTSQFTTSTNTISLNGGTAGSGGAPGFTAGRVTYLGVDATNGSFYYIGYAMEIIFYNSILNTTQRQSIEGYLARKWGISISATLPSPHPFKSFPPAKAPMIIGLVNRWIFNNGSGSTVTDTVGGQNISLSGTYTWSSSVPNSEIAAGSLSFNGYSGTGSASVNTTLQTSTYTMTLWYYHTGVSDPYGGNPMILQSGFNQNEAFSFATGGFTGTSKPYFYSGVYNGGFFRSFSSATPLNTWTHLAVTIGNSTYNAYQNGVLDSGNTNISITSGLPLTLNGSFIFAKGDSAYGNRFGGSLFDVRIYNRALSASEISQIYNGIG